MFEKRIPYDRLLKIAEHQDRTIEEFKKIRREDALSTVAKDKEIEELIQLITRLDSQIKFLENRLAEETEARLEVISLRQENKKLKRQISELLERIDVPRMSRRK